MHQHHEHHEHCCKHENVKYCVVCKVVYCKGCGKEWRGNPYNWYYPNYPYTYTIGPCSTTISGSLTSGQSTNTGTVCHQGCTHD